MRETILITLLMVALLPILVLSLLNWYILSQDEKLDKINILKSSVLYLYQDYMDDKQRLKIYTQNIALALDHFEYKHNEEGKKTLRNLLIDIKSSSKLDFITIVSNKKIVGSRANSEEIGDKFVLNGIIDKALAGEIVVSTEIISDENLVREGEELLKKTSTTYFHSEKEPEKSKGLFLVSAAPVYEEYGVRDEPIAVVVTGVHLNKGFFERDLIKKDSVLDVKVDIEPYVIHQIVEDYVDYIPLKDHLGEPIANLVVWYDPSKVSKILSDAEVSSIIMYTLTSIFIFFLSILISNTLVKPIEALVKGTREIADDNFDHSIKLHGPVEIEDLSHSFNKMASSLAEKRRMQEDFTATLTHDMRVPLLGEKKALALLLNDDVELSEMQKVLLDNMASSNEDLLKLVNTLLDTYKLEAGKYHLDLHECNLNELISKTISEIKPLSDEKHQMLVFDEHVEDVMIKLDSHEIKRVVRNLLSNAIKFTHDSGKIQVKLYPDGNNINISIADNGKGISEEAKEQLFERYASGAKKLKKVGTGLGLYLSYRIVLAHKGNMWVDSEIDKGSTFYISLPKDLGSNKL